MNARENITFPPGRLVAGSLYEPQTTNAEGQPLVVKNGPDAGKPRVDYFFALAIRKNGETHWSQTAWGAKIWALGHAAAPAMAGNPVFAWKVTDGDSTTPNRKNKRPCDREGYAGHWVVTFGGGYAPKCYRLLAGESRPVPIEQKDAIQPGDYIEVAGSVTFNKSSQNPGVFVNHDMVCLRGYGERIVFGRDVEEAGFGSAPLPAGASATPVGQAFAPPPPAAAPVAPPAAAPVAPAPVTPHREFLNPPAAAVAPPPPAAAPACVMTAKAGGTSYDAFRGAGWTDEALVREGYMLP